MSTNNNNDVPVFLSAQTSQVGGSKQTGISLATTLNSVSFSCFKNVKILTTNQIIYKR